MNKRLKELEWKYCKRDYDESIKKEIVKWIKLKRSFNEKFSGFIIEGNTNKHFFGKDVSKIYRFNEDFLIYFFNITKEELK